MIDPTEVFSGPAVTALGLAASRTVESGRSDCLISDPLARAFFEAAAMDLPMRLDWPQPGELVTDTERLHLHGSRYIGLRTRFYDDLLLSAADLGLRQAVLIGAGLDTRAFRLPLPEDFHLIESDRTALLEWKQTVLKAHGEEPRCRRSWIGADFRESWTAGLAGVGFDTAQPAAFIAEGLLPYLSPDEQGALFAEVHSVAATGSVLGADQIVGDAHASGRVNSLSSRSGFDMTQLLASGEANLLGSTLQELGWTVTETPVCETATSYGRDLTDPFAGNESAGDSEPPWLETRFLRATR